MAGVLDVPNQTAWFIKINSIWSRGQDLPYLLSHSLARSSRSCSSFVVYAKALKSEAEQTKAGGAFLFCADAQFKVKQTENKKKNNASASASQNLPAPLSTEYSE